MMRLICDSIDQVFLVTQNSEQSHSGSEINCNSGSLAYVWTALYLQVIFVIDNGYLHVCIRPLGVTH